MGLPAKKEADLSVDQREMGPADTLRYNIMTYVVEENYDRAIEELNQYMSGESEYPRFKERIERYVEHGIDLINAIRAKRKFPGASSLTMSKQQELNDKYKMHFNELQGVLKTIEKIQIELKLEDIRSTVYVVKAIINAVFAIAIMAFLVESSRGLFVTTWVVIEDYFIEITDWIFKMLNL